jgi:hypothetical protein
MTTPDPAPDPGDQPEDGAGFTAAFTPPADSGGADANDDGAPLTPTANAGFRT